MAGSGVEVTNSKDKKTVPRGQCHAGPHRILECAVRSEAGAFHADVIHVEAGLVAEVVAVEHEFEDDHLVDGLGGQCQGFLLPNGGRAVKHVIQDGDLRHVGSVQDSNPSKIEHEFDVQPTPIDHLAGNDGARINGRRAQANKGVLDVVGGEIGSKAVRSAVGRGRTSKEIGVGDSEFPLGSDRIFGGRGPVTSQRLEYSSKRV